MIYGFRRRERRLIPEPPRSADKPRYFEAQICFHSAEQLSRELSRAIIPPDGATRDAVDNGLGALTRSTPRE